MDKSTAVVLKSIVEQLLSDAKLMSLLETLYYRWQDESEYEDIADYGEVVKKVVNAREGVEFVKMTRRPFGFYLRVTLTNGFRYIFAISINSRGVYYQGIGESK